MRCHLLVSDVSHRLQFPVLQRTACCHAADRLGRQVCATTLLIQGDEGRGVVSMLAAGGIARLRNGGANNSAAASRNAGFRRAISPSAAFPSGQGRLGVGIGWRQGRGIGDNHSPQSRAMVQVCACCCLGAGQRHLRRVPAGSVPPDGSIAHSLRWPQGLHIVLAPLLPSQINVCRSDVNFLDDASRAVRPVLQRCSTHAGLREGRTGLLLNDSTHLLWCGPWPR